MLCYVTPKEHIGLPKADDVKAGCVVYKIAAHAADVAKGIPGARDWDDDMSRARAALNWPRQFELAFDGERARQLRDPGLGMESDYCGMCGHDWCAVRISRSIDQFDSGKDADFQPTPEKPPCHSDNVADAEQAKQLQAGHKPPSPVG
jgi:phosphomethylpyrimidine synthase